ncbi:MAG: hypothetical protein WBA07_31480, partial [Rivularia sp. (in: cyanobacteria)]
FEVLGIVAGGWLFYQAYERIKSSGKDLRAVRDFGCVAHLLDEDEFRTFSKQFGDAEVYQQLSLADERGWKISKFAQNWLNTRDEPKKLKPTQEVKSLETRQITASRETLQQRNRSDTPTSFQTQVNTYNPADDSQIDLIGEMTNRISNIFVVGLGGSGKGMVVANALRAVKQKHPDKKIFLINGKDDHKESGYFAGIVDVEEKMLCEIAKPATVAAWFDAAIQKFDDFAVANNGALLVIDEGTIIGARLKTAKSTALTDKLIGITSCGGSSGKNIWFIAQTPYVGANGGDLSGISQLTPIVLVTAQNLSILDSWKRAAIIKKFDADVVNELVEESEVDRAVYFGKNAQWYSMPKLKNHSSFNRDTGEIIGEAKAPAKTVIQQLEDSFKADAELPEQQDEEEFPLHPKAQIALDIIKNAQTSPVKFESIRKSREWGRKQLDNPSTKQLRIILSTLLVDELIDGKESEGYVLFDINSNSQDESEQ